jgi:hypothetical protein
VFIQAPAPHPPTHPHTHTACTQRGSVCARTCLCACCTHPPLCSMLSSSALSVTGGYTSCFTSAAHSDPWALSHTSRNVIQLLCYQTRKHGTMTQHAWCACASHINIQATLLCLLHLIQGRLLRGAKADAAKQNLIRRLALTARAHRVAGHSRCQMRRKPCQNIAIAIEASLREYSHEPSLGSSRICCGKCNPILSYPILSYPILSYPILSYPILSYPHLPGSMPATWRARPSPRLAYAPKACPCGQWQNSCTERAAPAPANGDRPRFWPTGRQRQPSAWYPPRVLQACLAEARAGAVRLDRPPAEPGHRAQATQDAALAVAAAVKGAYVQGGEKAVAAALGEGAGVGAAASDDRKAGSCASHCQPHAAALP